MRVLIFVFLLISTIAFTQSNTAVTSGTVGKCGVWDYPYTLYNNASTTHNINNGVTVTVDQDRSSGVIILNGNGAMDFNGGNGMSFSGIGNEITCRWDVNKNETGYIVNSSRNLGNFFTIPHAGNYIWQLGSGWSAVSSGAFRNTGIFLKKNGTNSERIFYQNEPGSCGLVGGLPFAPAAWGNSFGFPNSNAGDVLSYDVGTGYASLGPCNDSRLDYTIGNAMVVYDN